MSSKTPSINQVEKSSDANSSDLVTTGHPGLDALPDAQDWSAAEEHALVKKLDFRIIPMMSIVFALSLLDRANISAAYISGMNKDLAMAEGTSPTPTQDFITDKSYRCPILYCSSGLLPRLCHFSTPFEPRHSSYRC